MPKTPKIDVLTVKLTCDIPVNPGDPESVQAAATRIEHLHTVAKGLGQTTIETRLKRVPAPEPAGDGMDFPDGLDRRGDAQQDAAE